ncbi:MAG TPA: Crp/Fnr family transcriptional regulator [Chloroflexota bacterium]|nr:Crp/Fnr family transcriptional regulator [Chloroflexota bacterium]
MTELAVGRVAPKSALELLAKTPLFAVLQAEDLEELARTTRTRTYERGDIIFHKDDPGYTLYVIVSGAVKISVSSSEGDEIILAILTRGQFFGEMALFDEQPRSADAETIQPSEVLTVQREDLLRLLEKRPRMAITQLLKLLAQRLRATDELLQDAAFLDIPSRLAKRLLDLAAAHGEKTPSGTKINLRLTQQDLASMIGARRENVNRALAYYQSRGWLSKEGGHFTILNEPQLRQRALL